MRREMKLQMTTSKRILYALPRSCNLQGSAARRPPSQSVRVVACILQMIDPVIWSQPSRRHYCQNRRIALSWEPVC